MSNARKKQTSVLIIKKSELRALQEVHLRACYFLIDHVARSDDDFIKSAAIELSDKMRELSNSFKRELEELG